MGENIEVKDVQKTEYLDKNGLDMLWAKVKENTHNQVEVERNRAVAKENSIVDTKADKSEFSNYVSSATFTALEKKVSANTAAISNKQNTGNYLHYETLNDEGYYEIPNVCLSDSESKLKAILDPYSFQIVAGDLEGDGETGVVITSNDRDPYIALTDNANENTLKITREGISNTDNNANHVFATDGSLADLTQYALSSTLAALEQKVTANTTAISAKQDAGNYIPYDASDTSAYKTDKKIKISNTSQYTTIIETDAIANIQNGYEDPSFLLNSNRVEGRDQYRFYSLSGSEGVHIINNYKDVCLSPSSLSAKMTNNNENKNVFRIDETHFKIGDESNNSFVVEINSNGIKFAGRNINEIPVANGQGFINIDDYALKSELPTVPTKTSELTNDSNFITADYVDDDGCYLYDALNFGLKNNGVLTIDPIGIRSDAGDGFDLNSTGISFYARGISEIPTAQGGFIDIDDYALESQVTALEQTVTDNTTALEGKQDKGNYVVYSSKDQNGYVIDNAITVIGNNTTNKTKIVAGAITFYYKDNVVKYSSEGIKSNNFKNCLVTSDGTFEPISNFVLSSAYKEKIAALEARIAALEAKYTEAAA